MQPVCLKIGTVNSFFFLTSKNTIIFPQDSTIKTVKQKTTG